ncbi:MAG: type III-A CRISPR-associated RAMP protein Csm3 [Candidatus Muirbacterium halophilum]|nr:type III-A CRISPR-associated RAMP protein Csm3 [Candidatus Muirbacterium halophilum]MCK9475924.1 type III-A CRISPR-associated RAMP protein Csm3 [Candidatus Muirbacterium halophilum]
MTKLTGKVKINYILKAETGLHIGGNSGAMEIGGVDNPVLRNPIDSFPYIPGSSLKGKIRCLLEFADGKAVSKRHECVEDNCKLCQYFGSASDKEKKITGKLIFRDSFITDVYKEKLKEINTELLYTENKKENTIDRIKGEATPRDLERVPAETEFDVEIVASIYNDNYKDILEYLKKGIDLLEYDYLGGSGTRGSGKVSFKFKEAEVFNISGNDISKEDIEKILK